MLKHKLNTKGYHHIWLIKYHAEKPNEHIKIQVFINCDYTVLELFSQSHFTTTN